MYQTGNLIFLTCETPLHAGEGSDIGYIDLPIQREKHTHFPKVEASGLKGAFKDEYRNKQKTIDVESLFGPDNNPDRQGAIGFSNARILLFPACSIRGVFGWLTCPTVLKTFERDLNRLPGFEQFKIAMPATPLRVDECWAMGDKCLIGNTTQKWAVFEDFPFKVMTGKCEVVSQNGSKTEFQNWLADKIWSENEFWKNRLAGSVYVLNDDAFREFVLFHTEVNRRIKIDPKTGTVTGSALFSTEYVPTDSLLYFASVFSPEFIVKNPKTAGEMQKFFIDNLPKVLQIGGNATLTKGIVRTTTI